MTVELSPQKISKILYCFFSGMLQPAIAKKTGVNQSTVSRYTSRLKALADDIGLIPAAKEFGIMHEVDSLRSLAVELSKNKLTVEETKEGLAILKLFDSLGVPSGKHKDLVEVISKLEDHSFVPAGMKLLKLEATTGKSYTEIVSEFEELSAQIKEMGKKGAALNQENETLQDSIKELVVAKEEKSQELKALEKKAQQRKSALEAEVAKKKEETKLTLDRIEKLEPMAQALQKLSISDDKLEGYLKEHQQLEKLGIGWENFKTIVEGMKK